MKSVLFFCLTCLSFGSIAAYASVEILVFTCSDASKIETVVGARRGLVTMHVTQCLSGITLGCTPEQYSINEQFTVSNVGSASGYDFVGKDASLIRNIDGTYSVNTPDLHITYSATSCQDQL